MRVHCIGGPTQTHLSGFLLQLFLCIACTWGNCRCTSTITPTTLSVCWFCGNLDVLGLLVDLLLVDLLLGELFRFSARSSWWSGTRLHFGSVNDVFVHGVRQFSVDPRFLEPTPLPWKFPSVSTPGFSESTFVSRPCLSCFPVRAPVYRGCPCRDPLVCHRVQCDSVAKRQPLCVVVGVGTSCVLCARVCGHVPCSCATEYSQKIYFQRTHQKSATHDAVARQFCGQSHNSWIDFIDFWKNAENTIH